ARYRALSKAVLPDCAHQQGRTNEGNHDEDDPDNRRDEVVVTRRGQTPGDNLEENSRPSQSRTEHVAAGLLWLASDPREQNVQQADANHGGLTQSAFR